MRQKGSYTVEASLLIGILLSILVSVIYLGFWYHDRNFLQNAAYEAACTASLRADDESYQISGAARSLARRGYLQNVRLQKKKHLSFIVEPFGFPG